MHGEADPIALAHLCEFIEDCEFTKLSVRILHLLGLEGPTTRNPTKFIRYIYNRVVLENAVVRAAAVSSLAKFGARGGDKEVTRSVNVLLKRLVVFPTVVTHWLTGKDAWMMSMMKFGTVRPCTSVYSRTKNSSMLLSKTVSAYRAAFDLS